MKTLIISDLHLGACNSMTDALERFLTAYQPIERLVLNGDIIDNLNFKRFKQRHWNVIAMLRALAHDNRVVLIRGNHDEQTKKRRPSNTFDILPNILGTPFVDELIIPGRYGNYLILHGHRFDPTLNWPVITDTAELCYRTVQKFSKKTAKWLKAQAKEMGGVLHLVRTGAIEYAKSKNCNGVITGHTHYAEEFFRDQCHFLNCGSWVDEPCHYVLLRDGDMASLETFP